MSKYSLEVPYMPMSLVLENLPLQHMKEFAHTSASVLKQKLLLMWQGIPITYLIEIQWCRC